MFRQGILCYDLDIESLKSLHTFLDKYYCLNTFLTGVYVIVSYIVTPVDIILVAQ